MIHLSNEELEEFRQLWKEEFGEEITLDYARERATELLRLYVLLAGGLADGV